MKIVTHGESNVATPICDAAAFRGVTIPVGSRFSEPRVRKFPIFQSDIVIRITRPNDREIPMETSLVLYDVAEQVAHLTLNHPERNVLSKAMQACSSRRRPAAMAVSAWSSFAWARVPGRGTTCARWWERSAVYTELFAPCTEMEALAAAGARDAAVHGLRPRPAASGGHLRSGRQPRRRSSPRRRQDWPLLLDARRCPLPPVPPRKRWRCFSGMRSMPGGGATGLVNRVVPARLKEAPWNSRKISRRAATPSARQTGI